MAADYPIIDVLWTMIIVFCWVAWIWPLQSLGAITQLAWRNRQLTIVCRDPETSRRLRIAALDELATLVESA